MRHRLTTFASLGALLLASPGPSATPPPIARGEPHSPVRCTQGQEIVTTGRAFSFSNALARQRQAPPPPAPPMMVQTLREAAPPVITPSAPPAPKAMAGGRIAPYPAPYPQPQDRDRYAGKPVAAILAVADAPVSTFSVDVDTGAYSNVRRFLREGTPPPAEAVRTEELINYFRYDYPAPADRAHPFSVTTDVARTPWNPATRLLRIGLRGYDLPAADRPAANLVFLIDVSGSMNAPDKLPLVKNALKLLASQLSPRDRVSIVVYAGAAGIVLEPTANADYVNQAIDCLSAGGSTAGGQGIALAYATARANRIRGGVNRVILATDGDFNVGVSSDDGLEALVKRNREDGITLTTLGFGRGNFNESMMERIADAGNGNYAYIDSAIEARKVLAAEMSATLFTIAKDVKIQIEFNPAAVSQYRLIGYENRTLAEEDFANDKVDAGDIGAGHQVTALYEIVPAGAAGWLPDRRYDANRSAPPAAGKAGELAWLKLRYKLPDGATSQLIEQPIAAALIAGAQPVRGDMAFATAVAAYGQLLRGDKYMGSFTMAAARDLAGNPRDYLRQEFVELSRLAEARP